MYTKICQDDTCYLQIITFWDYKYKNVSSQKGRLQNASYFVRTYPKTASFEKYMEQGRVTYLALQRLAQSSLYHLSNLGSGVQRNSKVIFFSQVWRARQSYLP